MVVFSVPSLLPLTKDNFNVINVDWENGAKMPNYVQAAGEFMQESFSLI